MLYTIPDYYKEFQCTADKCEDTCCAGWQIVIDDKSLKKYKKIRGDYRETVRRSINFLTKTFRQDKEKRCAFLNDANLCELYIHQGKDSLCKTCRQYPRHIEEFEGVREITLSISCPEVAKIVMERKEPVTFLSYERKGEEEYEDFDPFLFSILEDARTEMINILQNREMPIQTRVILVLGMAHDMQGRINRQEMFDCMNVIDKYCGEKAIDYVTKFLESAKERNTRYSVSREWFDRLFELELLRQDWDVSLLEAETILYGEGRKTYEKHLAEFQNWAKEYGDLDIHLEQLVVYFLFTYMPGAVYDGRVYEKVQMAVYLVWMIYELWMARWIKNDKTLETDEMTDLVYRFSREVEHSDVNRNRVEKMMRKLRML